MNAIFGNLTTDGLEETQDRLGGFSVIESGAYTGTIKAAYAGQSNSGARSVTLVLGLEGQAQDYTETIYVTKRTGENYFLGGTNKDKKIPLPGFVTIDDLCLVTTNKSLAEQVTEDKVMNVYDPEAKKELPKSVPMLTGLIGKQATFGIIKAKENKNEKGSDGNYHPTPEVRETNSIEKIFHYPTNMTVVEARNGSNEAVFHKAWVSKNAGEVRDKREIKDGAQGGRSGRPSAPPQAANNGQPKTNSLFGS